MRVPRNHLAPSNPALLPARRWTATGLSLALGLLLAACGGIDPTPNPNPNPNPVIVTPPGSQLSVENLDAFPPVASDSSGPIRLVFNRIQDNSATQCTIVTGNSPVTAVTSTSCVVHDHVGVRIRNIGTGTVTLSQPTFADAASWDLDPSVTFPHQIPAGGSLDLSVRFKAQQANTQPPTLYQDSLTLTTDDPATPTMKMQLAGVWQATSQNYVQNGQVGNADEPSLDLIRQAMGWNVALSSPGDQPPTTDPTSQSNVPYNRWGAQVAQGDEVISAYWLAADPGQPVSVRQVASWSGQTGTAALSWYPKGNPNGLSSLFVRPASNTAQTLFPLPQNGPSATFTPGGPFGLYIEGASGSGNNEYTDPSLNKQNVTSTNSGDYNHGCANYTDFFGNGDNTYLCGHHLRFWPLTDTSGKRVAGAYFMGVDYQGINDDYQDELYVVQNVKPAPILIKTGLTGSAWADRNNGVAYVPPFKGSDGRVWMPDRLAASFRIPKGNFYFTPSDPAITPDEPAQPYTGTIDMTKDPGNDPNLYRTYRGRNGTQNASSISYAIPINNGTYTVKLYFVDQVQTHGVGSRVFDVIVNGQNRLPGFDIVKAAGGPQIATVQQIDNVQVTNGLVKLTLNASVDYPAISGIEIVR